MINNSPKPIDRYAVLNFRSKDITDVEPGFLSFLSQKFNSKFEVISTKDDIQVWKTVKNDIDNTVNKLWNTHNFDASISSAEKATLFRGCDGYRKGKYLLISYENDTSSDFLGMESIYDSSFNVEIGDAIISSCFINDDSVHLTSLSVVKLKKVKNDERIEKIEELFEND